MTPSRGTSAQPRPRGRGRRKPVIAVTGAAGPAGLALLDLLRRKPDGSPPTRGRPGRLIAIDTAERIEAAAAADAADRADGVHSSGPDSGTNAGGPEAGVAGVSWLRADTASPEIAASLAGADVVVHLAAPDDLAAVLGLSASERRLRAVRAAQAVTTAAAAVGAGRLVAVTSAMVFGARPENPPALADDAVCRAEPDDGLIGDLLEVERVLERTPRVHPGLSLTVIRPAALIGPGVDTAVTRHFEAPRLLVLRGTSTRWQFCHVADLAAAVRTAIEGGLDGWMTAGVPGPLDEAEVERLSGMRRLEVPAGLAFSTAERLHRVGVLPMPASELAFVVHPWVVGSERLLAAGWAPVHDNEDCLRLLMDEVGGRRTVVGRRVDRRDAAMGAAGAAVALLGTAAILRQARSRQSRRRRPTEG